MKPSEHSLAPSIIFTALLELDWYHRSPSYPGGYVQANSAVKRRLAELWDSEPNSNVVEIAKQHSDELRDIHERVCREHDLDPW